MDSPLMLTKDELVDDPLRRAEPTAHGPRPRDVTRVSVVFTARVHEDELSAGFQGLSIVDVVDHVCVVPARNDRRIGKMLRAAHPAVVVHGGEKLRLSGA